MVVVRSMSAQVLSASQNARIGYCAFEVQVGSPDGNPVTSVGVVLLTAGGQTFGGDNTNEQGVAMICDSPPGPVAIQVGGKQCGGVTVNSLSRYYMLTRKVVVVYDNCREEGLVPVGGCELTIRVRDQKGNPIARASFEGPNDNPEASDQTRISDAYGRIFRFALFGESIKARIKKDGYVSQELLESCRAGNLGGYDMERVVVLNKQR
jgi:hypothetical protein